MLRASLLLSIALSQSVAWAQKDTALMIFDLHFAVITKNPLAHGVATLRQLKTEVDILNAYFVTEGRQPIVKFRFKSAAFYDDIKNSTCVLTRIGDAEVPYDSDRLAALFNACDDAKVRDPQAINFYVCDSYDAKKKAADTTGHGKRNSNRPFVMLGWERLNHKEQSPEEHEMGHAFGLSHECAPGAKQESSTNIMASADCGRGSGGRRDIGFNPGQVKTILGYAQAIRAKLAQK
jgi:hypothetical protein